MRTLLIALGLISALCLISACAAVPRSSQVGQSADEATADLYRSNCASCHRLRLPSEKTRDQWQHALEKYGKKARLTVAQRDEILAWLQQNASDAAPQRVVVGNP